MVRNMPTAQDPLQFYSGSLKAMGRNMPIAQVPFKLWGVPCLLLLRFPLNNKEKNTYFSGSLSAMGETCILLRFPLSPWEKHATSQVLFKL